MSDGTPDAPDAPDAVEALLRRFEAYDPAARRPVTGFWPPPVRPARWNGDRRAVTADAIHYDRAETAALLRRLDDLGVGRGRILVSDFYSGLSSLLWGERFAEVHAISLRPFPDRRLEDGRFTLHFGRVGDMPFLYEAAGRIGRLDALLIDGSVRYDLAMILYYTFRPLVAPGGIVLFLHTAPDRDPPNGPPNGIGRFIAGLRSGEIDGAAHEVADLDVRSGLGVGYEIVGYEVIGGDRR